MRRGTALCLYRMIFGGLVFFPLGYALSGVLPYIGDPDNPPTVLMYRLKHHLITCAFWVAFGAVLGALWHLIERSAKNLN